MKVLVLICLAFVSVDCITRNEVISRAQNWANRKISYSMSRYASAPGGGSYRTDCSGYVSMAWKLSSSLSTVTLPGVATRISKNSLKKGDVMMKGGPNSGGANGHVLLFEKWANSGKTKYWAYEQTPPHVVHRQVTYPYFGKSGFVPYRYKHITDGGPTPTTCTCCKGNALGEFCGHELCGNCEKQHIYGCNKKNAPPSIHYGNCNKGCTGSSNSHAHCNK